MEAAASLPADPESPQKCLHNGTGSDGLPSSTTSMISPFKMPSPNVILAPGRAFFARFYQAFPDIVFSLLFRRRISITAPVSSFVTVKSCRNNLGIIDNQSITLIQIVQYIPEMAMFNTAICHRKMHKSGRTSVLQRILGDQLLGSS